MVESIGHNPAVTTFAVPLGTAPEMPKPKSLMTQRASPAVTSQESLSEKQQKAVLSLYVAIEVKGEVTPQQIAQTLAGFDPGQKKKILLALADRYTDPSSPAKNPELARTIRTNIDSLLKGTLPITDPNSIDRRSAPATNKSVIPVSVIPVSGAPNPSPVAQQWPAVITKEPIVLELVGQVGYIAQQNPNPEKRLIATVNTGTFTKPESYDLQIDGTGTLKSPLLIKVKGIEDPSKQFEITLDSSQRVTLRSTGIQLSQSDLVNLSTQVLAPLGTTDLVDLRKNLVTEELYFSKRSRFYILRPRTNFPSDSLSFDAFHRKENGGMPEFNFINNDEKVLSNFVKIIERDAGKEPRNFYYDGKTYNLTVIVMRGGDGAELEIREGSADTATSKRSRTVLLASIGWTIDIFDGKTTLSQVGKLLEAAAANPTQQH
jgi:hypothetical protein